ncbi:VOC family protein [Pleionea sediminis]|uniref:VOC family protein n=1 Tax=Pleionea sediminis TaxID=2569479 RepID=UPI001184B5E7|nr:VOC family protein [Pleionea sediminis]
MGIRTEYQPGTFCWAELATSDAEKAKAFYAEIFGWKWSDMPMEQGDYSMWQLDDKVVGAMYPMTEEQIKAEVPPHWLSYVSVANIDDAVDKIKSLGGNVSLGPHDVGDAGRMAFVQDPQGAGFALWEAKNNHGAEMVNEPGCLCWNELATKDSKAAAEFYCNLFGWTVETEKMSMGPYTMIKNGDQAGGGIIQMTEEWGDMPSHWMTYFAVDDTDKVCERVKAAGGQVCVEPFVVPEVGKLAVINDPQGAVFSIIKLDAPDL